MTIEMYSIAADQLRPSEQSTLCRFERIERSIASQVQHTMATRAQDVSLLQVEEELRAAEAYLYEYDASSTAANRGGGETSQASDRRQHRIGDDTEPQHGVHASHVRALLDSTLC